MILSETKNIYTSTNKKGRKSKQDKDNDKLEYTKYMEYIDKIKTQSVLHIYTISIPPWISLLNCIKNTFKTISLEIDSGGIKLIGWKWNDSGTKDSMDAIRVFGFLNFNPETYIIKNDSSYYYFAHIYECSVDKIYINLDTSVLQTITQYLTNESTLYLFIYKTDYNDVHEASAINVHINNIFTYTEFKIQGIQVETKEDINV
jgi:hypothetical protein